MTTPDFSTELGQRALDRLSSEHVIWLTTVTADGRPLPSPVWFLWQDNAVLIYSQPQAPKVRAIRQHEAVALNFNTDFHGDNMVVFRGVAEVVEPSPPADENAAYIAKYASGLESFGATPAEFAADYAQLIRVTLTGLRGG